ncbi:hypothetical protein WKI65_38400 [Streptomyces sp. MS1.AVA.3]
MALFGGGSPGLLFHTENHRLATALEHAEGVAARIRNDGFCGLHGFGELR